MSAHKSPSRHPISSCFAPDRSGTGRNTNDRHPKTFGDAVIRLSHHAPHHGRHSILDEAGNFSGMRVDHPH
ncbi:hypothetical protein, partial [Acidithiobacillus caldus]|uniref:hypothetical protein n=1 Tax=Acidithiobacillus caldus TaxID=33059 RepID=UPI001C06BFE9